MAPLAVADAQAVKLILQEEMLELILEVVAVAAPIIITIIMVVLVVLELLF
jgi:hypothetical protein